MNSLKVFVKKEILEQIRTKKFLIVTCVLLFFAFISAPTAKYMPELLKAVLGSKEAAQALGLGAPTYFDAYDQFFKNISQLAIVLIFVYMGSVSKEKDAGSAIVVLTKPITRFTMVVSKFLVATLSFTVAFLIGYGVHLLYTWLLFGEIGGANAVLSIVLLWAYSVFIIAITVSASAIAKKSLTAALISFLTYIGFSIISTLSILDLNKVTPGALAGVNDTVLRGNVGKDLPQLLGQIGKITWNQIGIAVAVTAVLIVVFLFIGIRSFEKQEL